MQITVEDVDPVTVTLTVEVEPERIGRAFDRAAKKIAKEVDLPGFRPGKAPRRLLEQRLGSGAIAQQAMQDSLTDFYLEAVEAEELAPVGSPDVDVETFDEDEGCVFEATVEVRPDFEPPDHEGIGVTFPEWDVTDEEIDEQLDQMRERFAEVEEVDRPAEDGDYVTLDLQVEVDGEVLEDARVEDAMYEVGSGGVTPGLDDEVIGREAGDEFTYTDELPEGYPEHGGEEADLTVTLKDVRDKQLPALDDDFAITASEFDTLDELRKDLRDSLLRRRIQQAQHELRGAIVEAYLANVDIPLPPSMVSDERDHRIEQVEQQAEQYGMDADELLQMEDTTREEFEETAREQAEQSVKAQLVLDELARELDLDVTEEDLGREISRHAQQSNMEPEEVAEIIQEQNSLGALVGDILRRKAIDAIMAAAEIEGGPSDDVLVELGLQAAPEEDDADGEGLIVPGQESGGGEDSELIVPGSAG